jgi:N-acylneuraminate cytidylyltransferase
MFIWHQSKKLKSINYDHKSRKRRQDIKEEYFIENGSIYVFTKNLIQTEKNRLGGKIGKYIMGKNKLLEIDTIEDYFLCKYYLEKKLWKKD